MFDVQNITVSSSITGRVCFTVHYIQGYTTKVSFVKLTCSVSSICLIQVIEEHDCFVNLPPCFYTLSAMNADAVGDAMPAVSYQQINIQGFFSTCTISENVAAMSTMSGAPRGTLYHCVYSFNYYHAHLLFTDTHTSLLTLFPIFCIKSSVLLFVNS